MKDIITPIIAAIVGKPDFSSLTFTINKSTFLYGDFINAVIDFVLVAAAIYFFVVVPLNKLANGGRADWRRGARRRAQAGGHRVLEQIRDLLCERDRDLLAIGARLRHS